MDKLHLRQLRRQRQKLYWQSIAPYFRYVGGSLLGFILIVGFGFYAYGYFVDHLPAQFPVFIVIASLLTIPVQSGNNRTYLREADVVFLLRVEHHMSSYLKPCIRSAYLWHMVWISLLWLILLPLYQATQFHSFIEFLLVWLQLAILQGVVMVGVWQENCMQERRRRLILRWLRPVGIGLLIYVAITQAILYSLIAIGLASIAYLLSVSSITQYSVNWERLIELEQRSRSRWISFFQLFVEVPREHASVHHTYFLHRMSRLITFKKSNAYRYLYVLTYVRSNLFSLVMRLIGVGVILIIMLSQIWLKLILVAVFCYVIKLQLSELKQYHKNAAVSAVYPVHHLQREHSARSIARYVLVVSIVILLITLIISV
jgi:ABC-2 type transport system permease protein